VDPDRRTWEPKAPWYERDPFANPNYNDLPLFHEATGYRRDPASSYITTYVRNSTSWDMVWAHQSGGNVALHDGSARWLPNVYEGTTWGSSKSWPSGGVYSFYTYYGVGLDKYVRQALGR
jgi:hypothetical protein